MKLKLDENLSRPLQSVLADLGHDVTTAATGGPACAVRRGRRRGGLEGKDRVLLTLDLEFGDLRKNPPGTHPGVVLFRPRRFGPLAMNRFVEEFVRDTDLGGLAGCVVIVDPGRVRVRRPPPDSREGEAAPL